MSAQPFESLDASCAGILHSQQVAQLPCSSGVDDGLRGDRKSTCHRGCCMQKLLTAPHASCSVSSLQAGAQAHEAVVPVHGSSSTDDAANGTDAA